MDAGSNHGSAVDLEVAGSGQVSCCFPSPPLSVPCVLRYLVFQCYNLITLCMCCTYLSDDVVHGALSMHSCSHVCSAHVELLILCPSWNSLRCHLCVWNTPRSWWRWDWPWNGSDMYKHSWVSALRESSTYLNWVQQFFVANDVLEGTKAAGLPSVYSGRAFALLSNLLSPDKLVDKLFAELGERLITHFEPKPVMIVEDFAFIDETK